MKSITTICLCLLAIGSTHAQQWTGSSTVNGTLSRSGNIIVNGLYFGRYGNLIVGDPNPYQILSDDGESHDLLFYGSSAATLHLRLYDGDLKFGQNPTPNAVLYNSGRLWLNTGDPVNYAAVIQNLSGIGKGLLVKSGSGNGESAPILQLEDNYGVNRFVVRSDGLVGIGRSPSQKLDVDGNINMAGVAGRRLYMGGAAGSTFGIAYDASYPSHGIFYTEGGPDYVSISPNGNANNGVMNIYGDGKIGIGTTTPKESLHVKGRIYLEGTEAYPSGWLQNHFNWRGHSLIMGAPVGEYGHSQIELKSGGSTSGPLNTYFSMFTTPAPGVYEEKIYFSTASHSYFNAGNLGVGTINPTHKLTVKGTVYSTEVKVDVNAGTGPDYVFEPTYNLPTLAETEAYIKANKHLPEVPSAKEMEANGINLSEMNMLLLKKVEELTLHVIELKKENEKQNQQNATLQKQINDIKTQVNDK